MLETGDRTRDRRVASLRLTTGRVPEQDTLSAAKYWFNPRSPDMTENVLTVM